MTSTSPRFQSLSESGLVTSTLKFGCVSPIFVVFQFAVAYEKIVLCSEKDCCVLRVIVVFWKRLLCSGKRYCVLENIVVFWKGN